MIAAVADTHTAIWYLFNNPRLSFNARQAIEKAVQDRDQIGVSSISLAEMVYLAEKGRIHANAVISSITCSTPSIRYTSCRSTH